MKKNVYTVTEWLAFKEIKQEDFDAMEAAEQSKVYNEVQENNLQAFKELQEKGADKEELDKAIKQLADDQAKATQKSNLAIQKMGQAIQELMKAGAADMTPKTLKDAIKAKAKEVIESIKSGAGGSDIEIKASTVRASISGNTEAVRLDAIGQLATKRITMMDLFPRITITGSNHNGTIRYTDWDSATTTRAADMVAEGGVFPESDAKWIERTLTLHKIGDTLPISEEFLQDEQRFATELEMFLRINVDLIINGQLLNGDGTGENLTGLNTTAPAYVPAASGITDASIYDLVVKLREAISSGRGAKYQPNFAVMNISDINKYKLKKDANNNYVMPPFVSESGQIIDGITIIEDNDQAANTMAMGDSRFGRIYEVEGFTVARGYVNAQFTSDMMTLKVKQRLGLLIRNVDADGFIKVTSISAALATLAS